MNDDERDQLLAELIEQPQRRASILGDVRLSREEREELSDLIETADALWLAAQHAPALEDDPVAAMLGLLPDPACSLDSAALKRARRRAGLVVSDVAERLQERGWKISKGDVFRWEAQSATEVSPAVVQSVAEILGTSVESLITTSMSAQPDYLIAVQKHPLFNELVLRWANARHVSRAVAAAALDRRVLATVHRGERPDTEQLLQSLEALVAAIEPTDER